MLMCAIRCASRPRLIFSTREDENRHPHMYIARCNGMSWHTSSDSPRMATHCPAATCALSSSATGSTDGRPSLSSCDSTEAFFPIASLSGRAVIRNNHETQHNISSNSVTTVVYVHLHPNLTDWQRTKGKGPTSQSTVV